jgi:hypothetical protein
LRFSVTRKIASLTPILVFISCSFDRAKTAPACPLSSWLRFRIDVGAPANINARISHLAESETASLKNAHAAAGAAAGRQRAAKELLSGEIPEGQSLEGHQYRTHLRL